MITLIYSHLTPDWLVHTILYLIIITVIVYITYKNSNYYKLKQQDNLLKSRIKDFIDKTRSN